MRPLYALVIATAAAAALSCGAKTPHPGKSIGIDKHPQAQDLYRLAERLRAKHRLPALGLGVIRNGRIVALGMAGERKAGSDDWATLDDRFDVASCSKALTATLAAMLVEQGVARWEMTIDEVFPEMRGAILPAYAGVTLEMLLRHRSGLDRWMSSNGRWTAWNRDHAQVSAAEQRRLFVAAALARPPRSRPDVEAYYTNDAYLIAGSMLEKATGKDWDSLARELVFQPLGLDTMRFGVPPADDAEPVAWGHEPGGWSGARPVKPDPDEYGTPPFGAPGGFLYCTVADLLRFVDFHIQGARGSGKLLNSGSFEKLHTPLAGQHFALGWEVEATRDAQGKIQERSIYHGGFSGRARANMWFCPESALGTVIVYNHGGDVEAGAYVDIFHELLRAGGIQPAEHRRTENNPR